MWFESKLTKRKQMRIIILCKIINNQFNLLRIGNIVHWLQVCSEDFVLIFRFGDDAVIEELQAVSPDIIVKKYDHVMVIRNENCRISGFKSLKNLES